MEAPTRERWQQIEQLADAALDHPIAERTDFLRRACGDDAELHAWVVKLLEAGEAAYTMLDTTAANFAPDLMRVSASGAEASPPLPPRIGPYRIVRELGRGGMGVVYLAEREEHFQQRVALKVVRRGLHLDPELVQRFLHERQILANLEHLNIARLLDGGLTEDGVPWFAMELVSGEPVNRACDARHLSIEARLELFCTVCDAVEYAHRLQIVHRDLKPSNILVNAEGTVKLVDFGIAKLVAPDHGTEQGVTRTGVRLLTPEYASPEQLRGHTVSTASDVYSLGVLLYELLTGRRPYRLTGRAQEDIEQAVLHQEPTRPSTAVRRAADGDGTGDPSANGTQRARARGTTPERLSERLRGDLDGIVLHAMNKDPRQRYASAAALASDVRRYLDGLPVARRGHRWNTRRLAVVAGAIAVFAAAAGLLSRLPRYTNEAVSADMVPVLAVGLITDYRGSGAAELSGSIADLLATNLGRVANLRVISTGRLLELIEPSSAPANAGAYTAAARRAGASMIVEGGIHALADGGLRLDLRRIDVATGNVIAAETVRGRDVFALVDSGTALLAAGVGVRGPAGSIADVTTRSEVAYRFYEEGLRAYYRGDQPGARRLFEAAVGEDTAFAMAAYYLALAEQPGFVSYSRLERAVRLADRASDRERLIIRAAWADLTSDPSVLATAETLAVRYPHEPYGQALGGRALIYAGDYLGAIRRLRQVVATDSSLTGASARCAACDARADIIHAYIALDSLGAAEREARVWLAIQPRSTAPWLNLHAVLLNRGQLDAAAEAYHDAANFDPTLARRASFYAYQYLLAGEYENAERELREAVRLGSPEQRRAAIWYLTIALRWQGRFAEALQTVRSYNGPETQPMRLDRALLEAQVLLEAGRAGEAAAYFDAIAHGKLGELPPYRARFMTWALAHGANALAAAGDTARLTARVDTIRSLGARSLLVRDQRMHHYVRGLVHVAKGRDEAAIAEFRQALTSLTVGYSRINYELARALLRVGRPRDAVAVLQPAVRIAIESTQLYVTRTELRDVLGQAWAAAGVGDSAITHYDAVLAAWSKADPTLRKRVEEVRARRAALLGARPGTAALGGPGREPAHVYLKPRASMGSGRSVLR